MCKYIAGYVNLSDVRWRYSLCVRFSCMTQTSVARGMGLQSVLILVKKERYRLARIFYFN